ncbi:hypothetical protein SteCoe_35005 [Stentor coeruleus]|uniref:Polycystin cation channel PKD1/PKD2 domain-containing protein n=1 Tax=Stentor coeruleus TaxID=5963 RepID=A0A1R2ATB0_9CILI|nr:hypothetical protein SteCoe_35005 [Stentor coeruleus]
MVKITRLKDRLYMAPLKKYEKYGKFPWKIIIQILLIVFTSCQTLLVINQSTMYSYNQYTLWNKVFLNRDVEGSDTSITNSYSIYRINQLLTVIQQTVERYYDINSQTIDNYGYKYDDDGNKITVKLLVEYFDNEKAFKQGYEIEYELKIGYYGPFSDENVQEFLNQVKKFELRFTLIHYLNKDLDLASDCYEWNIIQKYDYSSHGTIISTLDTDRTMCGNMNNNIMKNYVWISFLVIFLAVISLISVGTYINRRLLLVSQLTGLSIRSRLAWESLRISEKLKFFNFWVIIVTIGNLFQIFGGIISIISQSTLLKINETLVGFGCFFAWIGVIRFLNHTSHSYTIVNTMIRSAGTIGFYIIGIVPIFMGYAFLAMCSFWKTGIYYNTPMSLIANYAIVNGDSVYIFSDAAMQETAFLGQLYYYTFVVFFICFVHNIFIAIIERGFSSLRDKPPVQGDETSDDDYVVSSPKKKKIEVNRIKKKKSKQALKKILDSGSLESKGIFDEKTLHCIQEMDILVEEIIKNIKNIYSVLERVDKNHSEYDLVFERARNIIELQINPIVEYLN